MQYGSRHPAWHPLELSACATNFRLKLVAVLPPAYHILLTRWCCRYLATALDTMFELEEPCVEEIKTVTSFDWTDAPYIHCG